MCGYDGLTMCGRGGIGICGRNAEFCGWSVVGMSIMPSRRTMVRSDETALLSGASCDFLAHRPAVKAP